jgi:two-component system chemotaxis response regulator CheB
MSAAAPTRPVRVLVVDDSALNRRRISELLRAGRSVEVVGEAGDGEQALQLVSRLGPDAITLDLEMPRMNGFTFLRILMARAPTPVVVVSGYAQKDNVFRALELGAVDFVEKPARWSPDELGSLRATLADKIALVRGLRASGMALRPHPPHAARPRPSSVPPAPTTLPRVPPRRIVAIAASAGGPAALVEILSRLPERTRDALLVAQHMPGRFTHTFAERLDQRCPLRVVEAREGDPVVARGAFVCPGDRCMRLEAGPDGVEQRIRLLEPGDEDRYVPSADMLFESVARAAGPRAVGVVLSGMGDDGVRGARAIRRARGTVIVQSVETAVVPGMPGAVIAAGLASRVVALAQIPGVLLEGS